MKVVVIEGALQSRDINLAQIPNDFFHERELSDYIKSAELKIARQTGPYESRQGATITPTPCWAVEFKTVRRRTVGGYQTLPKTHNTNFEIKTAQWASTVEGTGKEKEKWRGISLEGDCSLQNLFGVVTSSWLVPFSIAHRYLVHIPAKLIGTGSKAQLHLRKEYAIGSTLRKWIGDDSDFSSIPIRGWTHVVQKLWSERKTDKAPEIVTDRLDYQGTLSSQWPCAYRVIYTRSRSFYAAVLDPSANTSLDLPFSSVKLLTKEKNEIIDTTYLPLGGVICDNLLHSVKVNSINEAYWMVGVFNSNCFNELVMNEAKGEPPGIYSIPVKILRERKLVFDPECEEHLRLASITMDLEAHMGEAVRQYLTTEKGIELSMIDDTEISPQIPLINSAALMRRIDADEKLSELEEIVVGLIK